MFAVEAESKFVVAVRWSKTSTAFFRYLTAAFWMFLQTYATSIAAHYYGQKFDWTKFRRKLFEHEFSSFQFHVDFLETKFTCGAQLLTVLVFAAAQVLWQLQSRHSCWTVRLVLLVQSYSDHSFQFGPLA